MGQSAPEMPRDDAPHGQQRQRDQSGLLTTLENTRRYSGLFFGLYIALHMLHQASAALGKATYDVIRKLTLAIVENLPAELALVWLPLAVHVIADVAFRFAGGRHGGGLRRRFSFYSGYALMALVAAHVYMARFGDQPADTYNFEGLSKKLQERGFVGFAFLLVLIAVACVHIATGLMNVLHQNKSIDRTLRDRLDRIVIAAATALGVLTFLGLITLVR